MTGAADEVDLADEPTPAADDQAGGLDPAPPDPRAWVELPDDLFAQVVAHARRALATLDAVHTTPDVKRLRAIPAAKLRRGGGRRRLLTAMSQGGPVWLAVRTRIETDPDLVDRLSAALAPETAATPPSEVGALRDRLAAAERARDDARVQRDDARLQRDRARSERDEARTQRDGATGREDGLRSRIDALQVTVATLQDEVARLTGVVEATDVVREQVVDRERRRAAGEQAALKQELAETRRLLDEARRANARLARRRSDAPTTTRTPTPAPRSTPGRRPPDGPSPAADVVVPGRPSRLPPGLRLDTREGVEQLLAPGRRVLVDGYNVTRTQRPDLTLEQQRTWLVNGLAALAASRRLDLTVVFDAHLDGGGATGRRRRGVTVQYSMPDMTADDELVFAVAAMDPDEPLIVVTDDRELRQRLAPHGVDLLRTSALAWLL